MNGSLDSMEKIPSHMSSLDATQSQSFDTYETRNPAMGSFVDTASGVTHPAYDLTFENRAFRDMTLSASTSRQPSREFWDGSTNTSTFKYHTPSEIDSTGDLKRSFDLGRREVEGKEESPPPKRSPNGLRRPPSMPPFFPTSPVYVGLTPAQRTKSQPLETAMWFYHHDVSFVPIVIFPSWPVHKLSRHSTEARGRYTSGATNERGCCLDWRVFLLGMSPSCVCSRHSCIPLEWFLEDNSQLDALLIFDRIKTFTGRCVWR